MLGRFPCFMPRFPLYSHEATTIALQERNKKAVAKKTFAEIVAKYPDTEAAKDAQQLLATIK